MKWIKIVLRGGKEFSFPEYKVIQILASPEQMISVSNKRGEWTGVTINKADISYTEPDNEKTRQWRIAHTTVEELTGIPDHSELNDGMKDLNAKLKL